MANFYLDNPSMKHHLHHPLMQRIVELKERGYADKDKFDYAPQDFEDAMDSYEKVLEIVGEICGEIIAPNAEGVDHEGPSVANGRVTYAKGTQENLDAVRKAGLMGIAMPRRYDGLNFPIVPYIMAADMVSRADAGFENLWGLQDCAETLYEFGDEDQRQRYIPRVCAGETMSMDLTEPDAGSDLQSVMLKATYCEKDDCWYLNGVKRFITNGDADIHLVLARSEEGTRDGRGLSMFIYDKRNGGVNVRRIENKMGIKGSPTCELVFKNAKAELCGDRKLGLIKYVMALMNGARLGIMLYETARFVDVYKALDDISKERKLTPEERQEMKKYSKLADAYTPMGKGMTTEYANQNAYDAIQIHGGSGFMKDYACERIYRDARITNIYEGTTQLQVVAAIRHVTTGTYLAQIREYEAIEYKPELEGLKNKLKAMTDKYEKVVAAVTETKDNEYIDFQARRMVEAAAHCVFGYLLLQDANKDDSYRRSAEVYINYGQAEVDKIESFINNFNREDLAYYRQA